MAASVYAFRGVATVADANSPSPYASAYVDFIFDPPSNIQGKQCYVECTVWNWDFKTAPSPALTARDAFAFGVNWSQVACGTIVDGKALTVDGAGQNPDNPVKNFKPPGRAPLALYSNDTSYSTGPVLCFMPCGLHTVTFNIYRTDGEDVCGGTTDNIFYAVLKIVAADSRQPQIGV